jgi:AcrR family transcriptional regulator
MIPNRRRAIVQERLQIPGKSADARAVRARDQIAWALLALLREKPYQTISVMDIARRAGVSRTTFYAHFQDRDDVIVRHHVVYGQHLGSQLLWDNTRSQYRFPIARLFEHVRSSRFIYEALSRARRMEDSMRILRINMTEQFERYIAAKPREPAALPSSLLAQHFAGTIVQLLVWWLEHHCPAEPQAMEADFHRLIAGLR